MRSEDFAFFCTSICVVRIAGEMAETGTYPDSAPQNPLNISTLSEAATILLNEVSGVPMRSAPRLMAHLPHPPHKMHTLHLPPATMPPKPSTPKAATTRASAG